MLFRSGGGAAESGFALGQGIAGWGGAAVAGPASPPGEAVKKPREPRRAADLAEAVTMADAARLLGVGVRTVQRYAAKGWLEVFYLPSGRPRVPLSGINAIRRNTTPPRRRAGIGRRRRPRRMR